CGQGTSWPYSF
nr:immunoglobulin light chain junction region [Macaca mulatta]MOX25645.1 immunoglobulin light chain junction region [Macaca mulatta]